MIRRSFLKAVAGLFIVPAVPVAKAFSGTITGTVTGSFSPTPTVTIGLSDERVKQLIEDGLHFDIECRSYDRDGVTVRLIRANREVAAEYSNVIYSLQRKTTGHMQLVTLDPSTDFPLPYDLPVNVG
jgi:hypothetical protein